MPRRRNQTLSFPQASSKEISFPRGLGRGRREARRRSSCSVALVAQKPQSRPVIRRRALFPSPCVRTAWRTSRGTSRESSRQGRSGGELFFATRPQENAAAARESSLRRKHKG